MDTSPDRYSTPERERHFDAARHSSTNQNPPIEQAIPPEIPQDSISNLITQGAIISLNTHLGLNIQEMPQNINGNYESTSDSLKDAAASKHLERKGQETTHEGITIKNILTSTNETIEVVNSLRITHKYEVIYVEKYLNICVDMLQDCISEVEKYSDKELNHDILPQKVKNLNDINKETRKAISIIEFRKQYPTARDVLNAYSPSEDLLEWHATFSLQCWKEISKNRAIKERGDKITNQEIQEYYENYIERLDNHALALVEPKDIQICIRRSPHKLLEILECGRIKSMFETQTAGARVLGCTQQAKIEEGCYGFPLKYPDEWRPLYACVTNGVHTNEYLEAFGAAVIRLKSSVRQRATKIMYDSAQLTPSNEDSFLERFLAVRPVPFNAPGRDCFSLTDPEPTRREATPMLDELRKLLITLRKTDPLEFETANDIKPWFEAEIHGAVTIDDIEEIHFTEQSEFEIRQEIDKKVNNEQNNKFMNLLTEYDWDVEDILKCINKKGLIKTINGTLNENPNTQIKTKLNEIHKERSEALEILANKQKETLKHLLKKRGITYTGL